MTGCSLGRMAVELSRPQALADLRKGCLIENVRAAAKEKFATVRAGREVGLAAVVVLRHAFTTRGPDESNEPDAAPEQTAATPTPLAGSTKRRGSIPSEST